MSGEVRREQRRLCVKGRKPNTTIDNKTSKFNPDYAKGREENTPHYEKAEFPMPEHFNEAEKKEWDELVELIKSIKGNAVTDADRKIMIIRVQAWSEYLRFDEELKRNPQPYLIEQKDKMVDKETGEEFCKEQIVKNPYYDLRKKTGDTVLKCDAELGLTPIARARIGKARTDADFNNADNLLSGLLNRKGDNG